MAKNTKKQVVNDYLFNDADEIRGAIIDWNEIFIRKNWNLVKAKKEDAEFLANNKIYRVACVEDGTVLYDFDAYDARPQFKDLLARSGQFLEVKLLYIVIVFLFFWGLANLVIFFSTPSIADISKIVDRIQTQITTTSTGTIKPSEKPQNISDILSNQGI